MWISESNEFHVGLVWRRFPSSFWVFWRSLSDFYLLSSEYDLQRFCFFFFLRNICCEKNLNSIFFGTSEMSEVLFRRFGWPRNSDMGKLVPADLQTHRQTTSTSHVLSIIPRDIMIQFFHALCSDSLSEKVIILSKIHRISLETIITFYRIEEWNRPLENDQRRPTIWKLSGLGRKFHTQHHLWIWFSFGIQSQIVE